MIMKRNLILYICAALCLLALVAFLLQPVFGAMRKKKSAAPVEEKVMANFSADSAYQYCADQCNFGPRTMNSEAHDRCGEWIRAKFASFGCAVESQKADIKAFDGTVLRSENIIARLNPDVQQRILICAHWDSRPWADNDADPQNHKKPVMGANDGASGVAVMLELARQLKDSTSVGIDFVCFDAEDWGTDGDRSEERRVGKEGRSRG